jgi:hypothetical protein
MFHGLQDGSAAAKSANRPRRQADIPPEEKVVEPTKVFVSNLTWTTSEEVSGGDEDYNWDSMDAPVDTL